LSDSGAGLPGCAHEREGLPDGVDIPRMVERLLKEFDPAGMLLLFCGQREFKAAYALLGTGQAQIV